LATLVGCIVTVHLGGFTKLDIQQEKYKAESAMWSAHSAIEEGWLPGGAVSFLRASDELVKWTAQSEVESVSRLAVARALERPIHQLIENGKRSPTQLLSEIRKTASMKVGFDAENGKIEDLVGAGILDSAKVLRVALRIAFSHVKAILQTSAWDLTGPTAISGGSDQERLK
jgi:chaperonin GroEL